MERKEAMLKTECSRILWAFMAVVLCAAPCTAERIYLESTDPPYSLETEETNYYVVRYGGTIQIKPGGYTYDPSYYGSIYIHPTGTLEIYGSHELWILNSLYVQVSNPADVKLFTDSADSIVLETAWGPDAELVGTTIIVDVDSGWTGKLTWDYKGISYSLNISTLSDIQVEVVGGPITQEVEIDIKPGSYPNAINLGSNGVIPVAILSTEDFAATSVNASNVFLAGSGVAVRGKGNNTLAHEEDVNGDGLIDLVIKVETENLDPGQFQDGGAFLRIYETSDPGPEDPALFEGWDEITIVPPA
jgi:hypothetical protein